MCGRFSAAVSPDRLVRFFDTVDWDEEQLESWAPNYNTAPSQLALIVRERAGRRHLEQLRWGLVPQWAPDLSLGPRMINARSETVAEKRSFARPFRFQRCLVPIEGFYEWQAIDGMKAKQPHYITRSGGEPVVLAGLWDSWTDGRYDPIETFTILTCEANQMLAPIHDRMPVVIGPDRWDRWLDPGEHDQELLQSFLQPASDSLLVHRPVGTAVNSMASNRPELRDAVKPAPPPPRLF